MRMPGDLQIKAPGRRARVREIRLVGQQYGSPCTRQFIYYEVKTVLLLPDVVHSRNVKLRIPTLQRMNIKGRWRDKSRPLPSTKPTLTKPWGFNKTKPLDRSTSMPYDSCALG